MTREEAIKTFEKILQLSPTLDETGCSVTEAMKVALTALRLVSREQVDKVWRGKWFDYRETSVGVPKRMCSRCGNVFKGFNTKFCEECGAPMTDEAVEMVMERLEALYDL